jgi:monoamine oxidase
MKTQIVIIGGGLSGLYAAYLLEQAGVNDYVILEARDRLGGRVHSNQGYDLGATWIWPELNPALMRVIETLHLPFFEQHESGEVVIEKSQHTPPIRMPRSFFSSLSIRLQDGMASLIQALKTQIPSDKILTDQHVVELNNDNKYLIQVIARNHSGVVTEHQTQYVLLAMPPRLAAQQLQFSPALPSNLMMQWTNTATWMAPHAKYVAVYPEAFWKQQGLSGQASSSVGPMGEVHDASMLDGHAALFGFIRIPYSVRQQLTEQELMAHCRAQLVRLFGSLAASPIFEAIKDWAADSFTTTESDWKNPATSHGFAPINIPKDSHWQDQLIGIGSEWSQEFSGYLAGCVDAATVGVEHVVKVMKQN